ncbi:(Fe-S)-binding protein [Naasia aerilata]|uniref:(Fe-S)-binding protein n=1 Tax=Naasia aerilata TaxID=1162966 RepID=UPI0025738A72|nr:FAD-linked oxidase C-terminal domain-containing protein [Naasia aerilata]
MEDAADLVVLHGGSLSGEHGDGRARSRLLERMYSPDALTAFAEVKAVFDPDGILNPGIVVAPPPLDAGLRLPQARHVPARGLALLADGGDVSRAVHRCVGVGSCRADGSATGTVMCPSYQATRDERDSTRGRARTLQEMVNGTLVRDGWRSPEVAESLDLCLSCRACSSDCPAGVDMAAYKTEMLYNRYRGRLRPRSHYAFGALPRWLRLASVAPALVNALARIGPLRRLSLRLAGADPRRGVPALPRTTFRSWWTHRPPVPAGRPRVALWADTFTDGLSPDIGRAAVEVLEDAGYEVIVPAGEVCCGLTWITTGQLDTARRKLHATMDALEPLLAEGIPVIGLEPSCTAVLRSDLRELLPGDPRSARIAAGTFTLAEFLSAPRAPHAGTWSSPALDGTAIVAQPHCHHHAVLGWSTDAALLAAAGATVTTVAGCCGLAGNFGMEQGHYDVSVAVAENALLPALRGAPTDVFLADGFSCRTQADQLAGRAGLHLAQLLARRLAEERRQS